MNITQEATRLAQTGNGFTLLLDGTTPVTGYAVSITNIFGPNPYKGIRKALRVAKALSIVYPVGVGGWYDGHNYFTDCTLIVPTLDRALEIAREYNQQAVWSFEEQKEYKA